MQLEQLDGGGAALVHRTRPGRFDNGDEVVVPESPDGLDHLARSGDAGAEMLERALQVPPLLLGASGITGGAQRVLDAHGDVGGTVGIVWGGGDLHGFLTRGCRICTRSRWWRTDPVSMTADIVTGALVLWTFVLSASLLVRLYRDRGR